MLATPGWQVLIRHVLKKQHIEQTAIIQGRCKDFEDYKGRVSFTDGMEFVTSLPSSLIVQSASGVKRKIENEQETE